MLFDPSRDPGDPRALRYCSNSKLRIFRRSIPLFYYTFIAKTVEFVEFLEFAEPTREMRIGSAVDILLLCPEQADEKIIVRNFGRSKADQVAKQNLLCEAAEKRMVWINADEFQTAEFMVAAARRDPEVKELLKAKFVPQKKVLWDCPWTDYPMKGFIDYDSEEAELLIDVKTTSLDNVQPNRLPYWAWKSGLHFQLSLYQMAIEILEGKKRNTACIYIANEPPYEVVYRGLNQDTVTLGHHANEKAMRELRDCDDFDIWTSRWRHEGFHLNYPKYAFFDPKPGEGD